MSLRKALRKDTLLDTKMLESKYLLTNPDLLRGSRKRKQIVMGDIVNVEVVNHDSQKKVLADLDNLARQTLDYEEKLKVLRQQLFLNESQNEKIYRKRIQQMLQDFQFLKQKFDLYKLGIILAKQDLQRKYRVIYALFKRAHQRKLRALKEKFLRERLIKQVFDQVNRKGKAFDPAADIAWKVYMAYLRWKTYRTLKLNMQRANIQKLRDLLANKKPQIVYVEHKVQITINKCYNQTVKPVFRQKKRVLQKREKYKVVKRPRVKPPKIQKKRQQIIFKQPNVYGVAPQAVTVHVKVQQKVQPPKNQHNHHKCHKKGCKTHSKSPISRGPEQIAKKQSYIEGYNGKAVKSQWPNKQIGNRIQQVRRQFSRRDNLQIPRKDDDRLEQQEFAQFFPHEKERRFRRQ